MNFDGGTGVVVVNLVDFVDAGDEKANLAGLGDCVAGLLQAAEAWTILILVPLEADLVEGVVQDADHSPDEVVMGVYVVTGAPDLGGDEEIIGAVKEI